MIKNLTLFLILGLLGLNIIAMPKNNKTNAVKENKINILDKDELLKNIKKQLIQINEKEKIENPLILDELKFLIYLDKDNYKNTLTHISTAIVESYFNTNVSKIFSSYYFSLRLLSLNESRTFLEMYPIEVHLKNLKAGNYTKVNFNKQSFKQIKSNKDGTYSVEMKVDLIPVVQKIEGTKFSSTLNLVYSYSSGNLTVKEIVLK